MLSRESELYLKGMRLEKDDVDMLLSALEGNAGNEKMRIQLIAYYFNAASNSAAQTEGDLSQAGVAHFGEHARHVLWFVDNRSSDFVLTRSWAQISGEHCPSQLRQALEHWLTIASGTLQNTKEPAMPNIEVLRNAAAQLAYAGDDRAQKIIDACRQIEPDNSLWQELESQL